MKRVRLALMVAFLLIAGSLAILVLRQRRSEPVKRQTLSSVDIAVALPESTTRRQFVLSCTGCHQLRLPSSGGHTVEEWETVFHMMRLIDGPQQYGTRLITDFDDHGMAEWLVTSLRHATPQQSGSYSDAVIRQYPFGPREGFYHDMEYVQGKAWIADFFGNTLYGIEPETGKVEAIPIPTTEGYDGAMGAHTINKTRDGKLWITFLVTCQVARFDPQTSRFTFYGGFEPNSHVHSFALGQNGHLAQDSHGRIWVTHFTEEYLSRLNPSTGQIERFDLPHSPGFEPAQVHPYAVAMDSHGRLWYTKLQASTIGVLDPDTREVKEFAMPREWSGPRRLAIDADDLLWIPEYATGRITTFDTEHRRFVDSYQLPSHGDYPYALRISELTGDVWVTGTGTDSLYRFDPRTNEFKRYKLPGSVAYTRMVTFDESGSVWTVYASFPNKFGPYTSGVAVRLKPAGS